MNTRLLTGAALALLVTTGAGAAAVAAPAKHKASADAATAAELRALRAKVEALEARLAAQEQAQRQIQAQAQQAQAVAQTAASRAQAQIETIPTRVQTAVAATRPKPGWEADTQVSGRMFYDLSHIDQKSNGVSQPATGVGFDIKRFYVGVDHKFNDRFSANITTDVNYVANDGETQVFVKKAYLQAKLYDAAVVRLGSADLPWMPFVEDVYGYRYVENVMVDRTKFGTSADWGVHLFGKAADGRVGYAVSVVDGAGYKAPLRSKGMDIEGRVNLNLSDFVLGVGGYDGKLGKDVEGAATYHRASRFNALAAYVKGPVRLGAEYFWAKNWNNVTTSASDSADGGSLFGSYRFTPEVSVFGRYDRVRPRRDTAPSVKDDYFNLGLAYSPAKIVDFALVYKRDKVEDGLLATANGVIGGTREGSYDEVGLFGQFRW